MGQYLSTPEPFIVDKSKAEQALWNTKIEMRHSMFSLLDYIETRDA